MVDSGAQGNFISLIIVLEHYLSIEVKDNGYQLVLADGKVAAEGLIKVQIKSVYMEIAGYFEII